MVGETETKKGKSINGGALGMVPRKEVKLISSHKDLPSLTLRKRSRVILRILGDNPSRFRSLGGQAHGQHPDGLLRPEQGRAAQD
jgi:hypothetical protein